MQRKAFFDFCETLVTFQTADAFVDYVRNRQRESYMHIINFILKVLNKIRVLVLANKIWSGLALSKRLKLIQLRGMTYSQLDNLAKDYYFEKIKPELISQVLKEMLELEKAGYEICIVSAGYEIYLKYFAKDFNISHVIATKINFYEQSQICAGTFFGKDCIKDEKVTRITGYFSGTKVDFNNSIVFSDNISDLPMMQLAGNGVVVSKGKSKSWVQDYGFKEIIWS
jgi:HAD superfamily hydrolase (TIGR01490 family)